MRIQDNQWKLVDPNYLKDHLGNASGHHLENDIGASIDKSLSFGFEKHPINETLFNINIFVSPNYLADSNKLKMELNKFKSDRGSLIHDGANRTCVYGKSDEISMAHLAIRFNDVETLKKLIEIEIDTHSGHVFNEGSLVTAMEYANVETLKLLYGHAPVDLLNRQEILKKIHSIQLVKKVKLKLLSCFLKKKLMCISKLILIV